MTAEESYMRLAISEARKSTPVGFQPGSGRKPGSS